MPYMTVSGYSVSAATDGVEIRYVTIGDAGTRAFDGSYRATERIVKREWTITTVALIPSDADALVAALGTGGSLTLSGDVVAGQAITCYRALGSRRAVATRGGARYVIAFSLFER